MKCCNCLFFSFIFLRLGIPYTHISSPMPDFYRSQKPMPRGVANRRAAINWIRQNGKKPGVMYFGDDDNTFDLRLFDEIRYTKRVSMFPVGLIGQYSISAPVVRNVSFNIKNHYMFLFIHSITFTFFITFFLCRCHNGSSFSSLSTYFHVKNHLLFFFSFFFFI